LLVASRQDRVIDANRLATHIQQSPFREALRATWRADTTEAVLARFVAGPAVARAAAGDRRELNTDDSNHHEIGFARMVGRNGPFRLHRMRMAARNLGADRPATTGTVDWERLADERLSMYTSQGENARLDRATEWQPERAAAHALYLGRRLGPAAQNFLMQAKAARGPVEIGLMAEGLADLGDEQAVQYVEMLGAASPTEADAVLGRLRFRQQRYEEAVAALERAFIAYRRDPWPPTPMMVGAVRLAEDMARARPETGPRLFASLAEPFAAYVIDSDRLDARLGIAQTQPIDAFCLEAIRPLDPAPWTLDFLLYRRNCYDAVGDPRAGRARADLDDFLRADRAAPGEAH
jgi:hypothetical protein